MNITATRIHTNGGQFWPDMNSLILWCQQAILYADKLLVATDQWLFENVKTALIPFGDQVKAIGINPWKGFNGPLNALLAEAATYDAKAILMQSIEVRSQASHVASLYEHLTEDTLVVGAKLTKEHGQSPGMQRINAFNSPWNTFALWDLQKLNKTGFANSSQNMSSHIPGGMEEVVTISLLQHILPCSSKSKLIHLPHLSWNVIWDDDRRHQWHKVKMATKYQRAEIQLQNFQHPRGNVEVI